MDTHPSDPKIKSLSVPFLHRRYSGILRVVINVQTVRIPRQMTLCPLTRKCAEIRLTSKTCYRLGSISTELAPQTL